MMSFKVKDTVFWESQAMGLSKFKKGKIIAVVPANDPISKTLAFICFNINDWKIEFDGHSRDHESYLVEVQSQSGRGKPKLYWPRVKNLQKLE